MSELTTIQALATDIRFGDTEALLEAYEAAPAAFVADVQAEYLENEQLILNEQDIRGAIALVQAERR